MILSHAPRWNRYTIRSCRHKNCTLCRYTAYIAAQHLEGMRTIDATASRSRARYPATSNTNRGHHTATIVSARNTPKPAELNGDRACS